MQGYRLSSIYNKHIFHERREYCMNNQNYLDTWLDIIKEQGYQQVPGVAMPGLMIPVQ